MHTARMKRRNLGLCIECGKNPLINKNHCVECRDEYRLKNRDRYRNNTKSYEWDNDSKTDDAMFYKYKFLKGR